MPPTTIPGLNYLNNRYQDPLTGVFLSVDPLVASTGHPYDYANNNPITMSDPSGLEAGSWCNTSSCTEKHTYGKHGCWVCGLLGPGFGKGWFTQFQVPVVRKSDKPLLVAHDAAYDPWDDATLDWGSARPAPPGRPASTGCVSCQAGSGVTFLKPYEIVQAGSNDGSQVLIFAGDTAKAVGDFLCESGQCRPVVDKFVRGAGATFEIGTVVLGCKDGADACGMTVLNLGISRATSEVAKGLLGRSLAGGGVSGLAGLAAPLVLQLLGNAWNQLQEETPNARPYFMDPVKYYDDYYPEGIYAQGSPLQPWMNCCGGPAAAP